ncbi:hypothetical protein KIL84_012726, partial [Mauremys mutica]
ELFQQEQDKLHNTGKFCKSKQISDLDKFLIRPSASKQQNPQGDDTKLPSTSSTTIMAEEHQGGVLSKKHKAAINLTKYRKSEDSYLNFSFICSGSGAIPQLQCVIYVQVLSIECLTSSKLQRHLITEYDIYKDKHHSFFEQKAEELLGTKAVMKSTTTADKKLLRSSYTAAQKIAKTKKNHTRLLRF